MYVHANLIYDLYRDSQIGLQFLDWLFLWLQIH